MSNKRYYNKLIRVTPFFCPDCKRQTMLREAHIPGLGPVTKGTCPQCGLVVVTGDGLTCSQAIAIADNHHAYPGTIWFD